MTAEPLESPGQSARPFDFFYYHKQLFTRVVHAPFSGTTALAAAIYIGIYDLRILEQKSDFLSQTAFVLCVSFIDEIILLSKVCLKIEISRSNITSTEQQIYKYPIISCNLRNTCEHDVLIYRYAEF